MVHKVNYEYYFLYEAIAKIEVLESENIDIKARLTALEA